VNLDFLLHEIEDRGIRLRAVGDRLAVKPMSSVTPELREKLIAHRDELLARLALSNPSSQLVIREAPDLRTSIVQPDPLWTPDLRIPSEVVAEIRRIEAEAYRLGWTHERLWNRDFWPHTVLHPRGLSSVIDVGERLINVRSDYITIEKLDNRRTRQRFWRVDA
jgi:tubulysin polyketide synthase-like protein